MPKRSYSQAPAKDTVNIAKQLIKDGDFDFFMRNKKQQEYHPDNVGEFTEEHFRLAYILQDMAILCTSTEITNFIGDVAFHLRNGDYDKISKEDLEYTVLFIRQGKEKYQRSVYVELTELIED